MRRTILVFTTLFGTTAVASAQEAPQPPYSEYDSSYDNDNADSNNDGEPDDTYDDLPQVQDDQEQLQVEAAPPEAQANVTPETFQQTLSPYGDWVQSSYGRVWRPNPVVVGVDFRPYSTGGHWAYSNVGWTWVSDYNWGWAPFHYGRWYTDASYGWVWAPDTTWGPAWVDWRFGGGYVGWAPLGPRGYRTAADWCFVPTNRFRSANVYRHYIPYSRAYAYTRPINRSAVWGQRRWYAGPSVASFRTWRRPAYQYRAPAQQYRQPAYQYRQPAYRTPAVYRPAYRAPAQQYRQPAQQYRQPAYQYRQPAQQYRQPAYRPQYRVPSVSGGGRGGGWSHGDRGGGDRGGGGGWHGRHR